VIAAVKKMWTGREEHSQSELSAVSPVHRVFHLLVICGNILVLVLFVSVLAR